MFWAEVIKSNQKYCICSVKWRSFRIVKLFKYDEFSSMYITPLNGTRTAVFTLRRGEPFPDHLCQEFIFDPFEHVKIEVISGDVTVIGDIVDAAVGKRSDNYPLLCPFAGLDNEAEWIEKNRN